MQNQEHIYETPEPREGDRRTSNTDPREQVQRPAEEGFRSYAEGYSSPGRGDIWSEGEKLRAEHAGQRNMGWFFLVIALICVAFILGSVLGAIILWLTWLIIAFLLFAGLIALILNWRVVTIPMPERHFQISEHAQLVLHNSLGRVAIRRGEPGAITVAATKRASGFGINPEQMQIFYDQRGDLVNISTRVHWNILQFGLRSIHFEITVPENCDVQLDNGSGRVFIQGTSGDIRLRTGSGGIEAYDLRGNMALKTGSGGVKLANLQGDIFVQTGSGGIESAGLRGQVALKTGSGGVTMQSSHLAGSSRITTGSGGITFDGTLDTRGDTEIKTGSGGIKMILPVDAAFDLNAKTGSGGVHNDFEGMVTSSGPRARLRLRTGSGGIHITRGGFY